MRRYDEPAQADTEPGEAGSVRPLKFHAWRRTYLVTEILRYWSEDRQWWKPGASDDPSPIWFWRVRAVGTRQATVFLREDAGTWTVVGIED
ncbi:hypothetical protein [Nonomuraea dietziae]|uniref:hypothetical protein n=1 Tax=Nonomuraea dietziae TaxID=65515 RepID=UPI00341BC5BF